jgi:tripartite-type tricarboxylate transporter receptor subunit TctC
MLRIAMPVAVLLLCAAAPAAAQEYPSKPIRLVIGFPPGGATDLVARLLQKPLAEFLGQEILVDNRPGANGVIGAEIGAKAAPDGYTLHLATMSAITISPAISKTGYDAARDFTPLGRVVELQNIFIAHPKLPVRSMQELIAYAKAKPGVLNYATSGAGGAGHLSGELLRSMTGIDIVHVPYRGGGPAMTDLLAGQIELFCAVISTAVPYVKQGRVHALAVTGAKRAAALPEVPTVAESGLPGYDSSNWYGLVGPAGLPKHVVERWQAALAAVLRQPEVRQQLLERGIDAAPSTGAELAAYMRSESEKWVPLARSLNLQPN